MTPIERFMSKVQVDADGCWQWCGTVMGNGYGAYNRTTAHRWGYTHLVAPIPPGHDLDHLCRNRACVNPGHLEPVTRGENLRRGWASRPTQAECKNGHPLTANNLTAPTSTGKRQCKTCAAAAKRRYKLRRRMAAVTRTNPTQPERNRA